jgi:sulfur carrier protein ThiS
MTKEEFAQYKELIASVEKREEEEAAKQLSKEALLEKLGITAEEAALLLG